MFFETVPDLNLILSPEFMILNASNAFLKATLTERSYIIGKYFFEAFPDNPEVSDVTAVANLISDITDRKQAENKVRISNKLKRISFIQF